MASRVRDHESSGLVSVRGSFTRGITITAIVLGLALGILITIIGTVHDGYVGIRKTFGRVEPGVLEPGWHVYFPITQDIVVIETRVRPYKFENIDAAGAEMQSVRLTGVMNYHIRRENADELYKLVGLDFDDKVIDAALKNIAKEVIPQYRATEILPNRERIRAQIVEKMNANLDRYGIVVDDIYISNIAFSDEYQQAIERKQTAQQEAEAEKEILRKKEIQAQQLLVDMQAQADAEVIRAKGEAQANQERVRGLTRELIEYLKVTKWDGKMPQVVAGNAETMIQLPTPPR